jgi:hypothetical protein
VFSLPALWSLPGTVIISLRDRNKQHDKLSLISGDPP